MSTEFVSLNKVFLPTTGGDIEGSLDVNGLLTVNDKSGNGTVYDVADEIAALKLENDELKTELNSMYDKLNSMFGESYELTATVSAGSNYSSVNGSAYLIGNRLRLYFSSTRSSATSGNITNETVCTYTIDHGGKIANAFNVGFTGAGTGGNAQYITDVTVASETITVSVTLGAVAQDTTSFNAYFSVPVILNLDAF